MAEPDLQKRSNNPSDGKIHAPFTPEQVAALNSYQHNPAFHPYTCVNDRRDKRHMDYYLTHSDVYGEPGVLEATPEGLVCPACGYKQTWALDLRWEDVQPEDLL